MIGASCEAADSLKRQPGSPLTTYPPSRSSFSVSVVATANQAHRRTRWQLRRLLSQRSVSPAQGQQYLPHCRETQQSRSWSCDVTIFATFDWCAAALSSTVSSTATSMLASHHAPETTTMTFVCCDCPIGERTFSTAALVGLVTDPAWAWGLASGRGERWLMQGLLSSCLFDQRPCGALPR